MRDDGGNSERKNPVRILRLPQVCEVTGLRKSTIYRYEADGYFPKRTRIGRRAVGWIEEEVQTWIRARAQENRGGNGQTRKIEI